MISTGVALRLKTLHHPHQETHKNHRKLYTILRFPVKLNIYHVLCEVFGGTYIYTLMFVSYSFGK